MDVRNHRARALRPRRNELVRVSDRVEGLVAVLLLSAALAAIGLALWIGNSVADDEREAQSRWLASSYPVTAKVAGFGHRMPSPAGDGLNSPWLTPIIWAEPDGTEHRETMPLAGYLPTGAEVPVRIDSNGRAAPLDAYAPRSTGIIVGTFALLSGWVALGLLWLLAEHLVMRYNLGRWEAEWRRVQRTW